jgi:hypothetical protein
MNNYTPRGGYDVLYFGDDWLPIIKCFPDKRELQKCLIWLKHSDLRNGTIYCESSGVADYVRQNWGSNLAPFAEVSHGHEKIKRMDKSDYKIGDSPRNGLAILIAGQPINEDAA